MLKKVVRIISSALLVGCLLFTCGCSGSRFEVVLPPIQNYPTPEPYEFVEVTQGYFCVEKVLRGNKKDGAFYSTTTASLAPDFSVGDQGYVLYEVSDTTIKIPATLTATPSETGRYFIVTYDTSQERDLVNDNRSGKFCKILYEEENCLMIPKNAVWVVDTTENAYVHILQENNTVKEQTVAIGLSNDTHYQVISGLKAGDKVVVK